MTQGSTMLINTFHELEPTYVQNLKILMGKPIWAIGKVLTPNVFARQAKVSRQGKRTYMKEEEVVRWLNSQ